MNSENENRRAQHRFSAWAWPVALTVCFVCSIFLAGYIIRGCTPAGIAAAFKPEFRINSTTAISTSADKLRRTGKLVVLQSEVSVNIVKENTKILTVLGQPVNLGTTKVTVRCGGNKIQYYVPLEQFSATKFTYNSNKKQLVVAIPPPLLDETMVDVQSDPSKIEVQTEVGWARLDSKSGQTMRQSALKELRAAALQEGRAPIHAEAARTEALGAIQKLLSPLSIQLNSGVELMVEFER